MMEDIKVFEDRESQVRSYCRKFPFVFDKALNDLLITENGEEYIDFFNGAGALNYGHNNPYIKKAILDYLATDNIIHALDMYTVAKKEFLRSFDEIILKPRNLDYKVMSCGSTGTNAVEAALKLARKNTGRTNVIAFHGAFHGMTLGSLACTGEKYARKGAAQPLANVTFAPYANTLGSWEDSIKYLRFLLEDDHTGCEEPAAIILETVQAEGGINVAEVEWLKAVRQICDERGIMMIVDDIQVGNTRTGHFFSFERAGIVPDMVTLSKSISGFGQPMSLLLVKPEYDIFGPAEHNGTWRGNQLGFVGARAALEFYRDNDMDNMVARKGEIIRSFIEKEILPIDSRLAFRGIGLIWGIDFSKINPKLALEALHECVDNHVVIELCGSFDCVLKILPALTIEENNLVKGLEVVRNAIHKVLNK